MEGLNLGWMLNEHHSQILSSLHLEQTSPGFTSAIFMAVISMSLSNDLVMGFPIYHANLRNFAFPSCDSYGVYAVFLLLSVNGFWIDLSRFSNHSRSMGWGAIITLRLFFSQ
jgi:hypothetical protein